MHTIPTVQRGLKQLGSDLKIARIRRQISSEIMSQRLGVSRPTLIKLEKGDPNVSIETYMNAIYILDGSKINTVFHLFQEDSLGMFLSDQKLPQRVRTPKRKNC
jgi:DNA-binding XRE family transcriptional regulator